MKRNSLKIHRRLSENSMEECRCELMAARHAIYKVAAGMGVDVKDLMVYLVELSPRIL